VNPVSHSLGQSIFAYSALGVDIIAIITFVVIFIGFYAGSMPKKPSAKTKE
jgi:hypothetical protein